MGCFRQSILGAGPGVTSMVIFQIYPVVNVYSLRHRKWPLSLWIYPLKMVISHSHVSFPGLNHGYFTQALWPAWAQPILDTQAQKLWEIAGQYLTFIPIHGKKYNYPSNPHISPPRHSIWSDPHHDILSDIYVDILSGILSDISSDILCDILYSQWRSCSAHWNLALAVEVR